MSLYVKFIWFTFVTMLISSIISFFAMNTYYQQHLKAENNDKYLAVATSIIEYADGLSSQQVKKTLTMLGDVGYQLYVTDGDVVDRFGWRFRDESIDEANIQQVLNGEVFNGIKEFPRETFVTGFFSNELENTVGVPLEIDGENYALFLRPNIKLLFHELHLLFGGMAAGIIFLSVGGMLLVARLLIKPITRLTEATEKLGTETFDVPLSIDRRDEIGRLADQFVKMRIRIEQSTLKRKEFVHNVSHDIQSPLHTIQSYLSLLQQNENSEEEKKQYAAIIQDETTRLSMLTKQLLTLASFDTDATDLAEDIFIDQQIREILSHLRYAFDEKELGISAKLEPVKVKGNAVLLQTVWENLLTNAIKYSEPGDYIEVHLRVTSTNMVLEIRDEGIGMTADEASRAFDRFYRADQARLRSLKGSGLGLAIVKEIVELHKGTIEIKSEYKIGTTVITKIPLF